MLGILNLRRIESIRSNGTDNLDNQDINEGNILNGIPLSPIEEFFQRKNSNFSEDRKIFEGMNQISQKSSENNEEIDQNEKTNQIENEQGVNHKSLKQLFKQDMAISQKLEKKLSFIQNQGLRIANKNKSILKEQQIQILKKRSLNRSNTFSLSQSKKTISSSQGSSQENQLKLSQYYFREDKDEEQIKEESQKNKDKKIQNQIDEIDKESLSDSSEDKQNKVEENNQQKQEQEQNQVQQRSKQSSKYTPEKFSDLPPLELKNQVSYEQHRKQVLSGKITMGKPYDVLFRYKQFFKFLFYFILYQMVLGPLSIILLKPFEPNIVTIFHNLRLIGKSKYSLYHNARLLIWWFLLIVYLFIPSKSYLLDELVINIIGITIGVMSVKALQFGYMHPTRIQQYENTCLRESSIDFDRVMGRWSDQNDDFIEKEIKNSMARLEIEYSSFYMGFMVDLEEDLVKNLQRQNNQMSEIDKEQMEQSESCVFRLPYGINIFKLMLNSYNQKCFNKKSNLIKIVASIWTFLIICLFVLNFVKVINSQEQKLSIFDAIYVVVFLIYLIPSVYCVFYFNVLYVKSLERKLYVLNQLTQMISCKKIENDEVNKKLLPTLNLLCPVSLKSWSQLRRIVFDYGKKQMRVLFFFVLIYCILIILQTLYVVFLVFYQKGIEIQTTRKSDVQLFILELFFFGNILVRSIILGAKINQETTNQKHQLQQNKFIFNDIKNNGQIYLKVFEKKKTLFSSPLYQAIMEIYEYKNKFYGISFQDFNNILKNLLKALETHLRELEITEIIQPYRVLGVAMTKDLAVQIGLSVFSMMVTLFIDYYNKNIKQFDVMKKQ